MASSSLLEIVIKSLDARDKVSREVLAYWVFSDAISTKEITLLGYQSYPVYS